MKNEKNEKQCALAEARVLIPSEKNGLLSCPVNECVCKALEHNIKVSKLIYGSIFFTAHIAALICLVVTFGGGKVRDEKLLDFKLKIESMRYQHDLSLRNIRSQIRYIESLIDERLKLEKQRNTEKMLDFDTIRRHESTTVENEDVHLPEPPSSNVSNELNMTFDNEPSGVLQGTLENIGRSMQNSTNIPDHPELLSEELCSKLSTVDIQDVPEYSRLCKELEIHSSRTKRSNMRGKQNGRKSTTRRRVHPHKKPNIRGPVASHFKGGVPETYIRDGGSLLAPWYPDDKASAAFTLKYEFREGKGTIEVTEEGLYLIYAQVYYLTTEPLNTYVVNMREKDAQAKPIAFCSSNAVIPEGGVSEVSCYTSAIRYLNATNQIFITQRDRNRRMILRDGHSFLGLICLNSVSESKRRRNNRN